VQGFGNQPACFAAQPSFTEIHFLVLRNDLLMMMNLFLAMLSSAFLVFPRVYSPELGVKYKAIHSSTA